MTEQEETKTTNPGEHAVVRAVCAVAFLAVAASLYGKAFPEPTTVEVRAPIATPGEASDTCAPFQAPRYSFVQDNSGGTLVTAWVRFDRCYDTAEAAKAVRSLIATKMSEEGIGDYGLNIEFYDADRPFRQFTLKYHFPAAPQKRA